MPQSDTPIIDDHEIKRRVESIAGKNARVVDCEKKSSFVSEETLLINGIPVKLEGRAGEKIKEALKSGQPPPVELLSEILVQAGIEKNPVQLETTMTVKSSTKTSELSTLRDRNGKLMDEKLKEFEEDDEIQTASVEIWEKDSDQAHKLKKTFEEFRTNMEPFIAPKPLPRTYTPDRTPPKTPQSPQSPTENPISTPMAKANGTSSSTTPTFKMSNGSANGHYNYNNNNNNNNNYSPRHYSQNQNQNQPLIINSSKQQRPSEPPPRIPSLMKPLKLNKPIPPPKPTKSKQVADVLRREKNFELPVRVVYETFI